MSKRYIGWSITFVLGISLIALTAFTRVAASQDVRFEQLLKGSLLIVQGAETTPLEIVEITTEGHGEIHLEIAGAATFVDGSQKFAASFSGVSRIMMPAVRSSEPEDESFINVSLNGKNIASLRVQTVSPEHFAQVATYARFFEPVIQIKSDTFAVIDEARLSFGANEKSATSSPLMVVSNERSAMSGSMMAAAEDTSPIEYTGAVVGPFRENDGYYARFANDPWKYLSWNDARKFAERLFIRRAGKTYKGFLATPNTSSENNYIKNSLAPNEDWIGLFQGPGPKTPDDNWWFLNSRRANWYGWGYKEPDDQKNGAWTRCTLLSFFDGFYFTTDGNSVTFGVTSSGSKETGCENCGMMRADGKWKDKECKSHGNGFIVEFRNL